MYILTPFVESRPLPEPATMAERKELVTRLVRLVRPFHEARVQVSRARRWGDRLARISVPSGKPPPGADLPDEPLELREEQAHLARR